jgi:acetylornithine/succinyldiaminopimelate/putrescine aminotransferase
MPLTSAGFETVCRSLSDVTCAASIEKACEARAALSGEDLSVLRKKTAESIDLYPEEFQKRQAELLSKVGCAVVDPLPGESLAGASTKNFNAATKTGMSPLSAAGMYRIGEDGRLYLITKSEHYHAPLGHSFPGYALLDHARDLGIPNATHNNTRGWITRLLEERLVSEANGLDWEDAEGLKRVLPSEDPNILNRVLNLETGSLAAEAALKMILARFYRPQEGSGTPLYEGRIPVLLVVGNDEGGAHANYHGTTFLTQTMRGMWPDFESRMEAGKIYKVHPIRPNHTSDLEAAFEIYEKGDYKIAGFFHEIVMMNFGARLLSSDFLHKAYQLCRYHDVPTVVDEIQSCMWAPGIFLFKEYGLRPSFVALGKGFSGGEYPASRILFSGAFDNLPQFGALVTNGQEELASLSYLITLAWAKANAAITSRVGEYYQRRFEEFARKHNRLIVSAEGWRHLSALRFRELGFAKAFVSRLVEDGLDMSVQTYKADAPPVMLTKIPLIADERVVDFILQKMEEAILSLGK